MAVSSFLNCGGGYHLIGRSVKYYYNNLLRMSKLQARILVSGREAQEAVRQRANSFLPMASTRVHGPSNFTIRYKPLGGWAVGRLGGWAVGRLGGWVARILVSGREAQEAVRRRVNSFLPMASTGVHGPSNLKFHHKVQTVGWMGRGMVGWSGGPDTCIRARSARGCATAGQFIPANGLNRGPRPFEFEVSP
jgi:hypothetical protein